MKQNHHDKNITYKNGCERGHWIFMELNTSKRDEASLSRQPRLMCSWSSPKVGVSHVASGFVQQRGYYAHKSKWSLGARGNDDQMINL